MGKLDCFWPRPRSSVGFKFKLGQQGVQKLHYARVNWVFLLDNAINVKFCVPLFAEFLVLICDIFNLQLCKCRPGDEANTSAKSGKMTYQKYYGFERFIWVQLYIFELFSSTPLDILVVTRQPKGRKVQFFSNNLFCCIVRQKYLHKKIKQFNFSTKKGFQ